MEYVALTEAAALQIKEMMQDAEEDTTYFKVTVKGGGCVGLTYGMGFAGEQEENDVLSEQHGIKMIIDQEDRLILKGTTIDYKQSIMGGGFVIDNPNAVAPCGCGASFRTEHNAGTPEQC